MGTFLDDSQVSIATLPYMHQEFCTCGGDAVCVGGNSRLFPQAGSNATFGSELDWQAAAFSNPTSILPPLLYNRTCPDALIQHSDSESLDSKLLNLQPWRGLDWQM